MSSPHDDRSISAVLVASQHASDEDREALETEVVSYFRPMTHALASRYRLRGVEVDDLEQVADLALLKAMRRYAPAAGYLRGYVAATVLGEIKRHFRDFAWSIRPPRYIQDLQSPVAEAISDGPDDLGDASSVERAARLLQLDRATVIEVLQAREGFRLVSLDRSSDERPWSETADTTDPYRETESRLFLGSVFDGLAADEREILRLRFVEQLSQREIATLVRSTQKQVSRTLERVLSSLRQRILSDAA